LPNQNDLPDFVKTAGSIDQNSSDNLFALVMVEDNKVLKKFATADKGNTWLSSLYFSLNKDKLPAEAQKVAAANLLMACEHFGIDPTEDIVTLSGDYAPTTNLVDVTSKPLPLTKKASEAIDYALTKENGEGVYPINSAASVKAADKYFSRHEGQFEPRRRREFAVKVAAAADKAGMSLGDEILKYAGEGYSRGLQGHLDVRRHHIVEMDLSGNKRVEFDKLAAARRQMDPSEFAENLYRFDRSVGLDRLYDRDIADPWYATFNMSKVAKGSLPAPKSFDVMGERVTEDDLNTLAEDYKVLVDFFGESAARSFASDPAKIFASMPLPQKKLVARWASDTRSKGMS
ncbi:MAG: hypothetical protein VXZ72_00960, partial [Chlamydiota bacterium]|nr:hypothetical protein [Chlamydiota bacterium]